jgi:hypothetical protein
MVPACDRPKSRLLVYDSRGEGPAGYEREASLLQALKKINWRKGDWTGGRLLFVIAYPSMGREMGEKGYVLDSGSPYSLWF